MDRKSGTTLEVEDEEQRQQRIGTLLEQLNVSSSVSPSQLPAPASINLGLRETYAVEPPTELLARIHDFLPRLKADNEALAQRARINPRRADIENIEGADQYIEMNLGLGVFESRKQPNPEESNASSEDDDSDTSAESSSSVDESSDTPEDDSSDSDDPSSDSSSDSDSTSSLSSQRRLALASRPMKPLPRRFGRAPPKIEILSDTTAPE
ncbi:hypothetical protein BJ138DRAFT_1003332 [Hygrophoropsis aurantiaca]|uniref:Uncharacterized protein n=1 Tax=Hygrophoropsis aurantiaca TaxID=72124 RepID=A0ACB8AHV2_9AGAM|nr:hypothetical protein BJ138DRAFT_1003332 [Hygrophoropsis aurantiaca]